MWIKEYIIIIFYVRVRPRWRQFLQRRCQSSFHLWQKTQTCKGMSNSCNPCIMGTWEAGGSGENIGEIYNYNRCAFNYTATATTTHAAGSTYAVYAKPQTPVHTPAIIIPLLPIAKMSATRSPIPLFLLPLPPLAPPLAPPLLLVTTPLVSPDIIRRAVCAGSRGAAADRCATGGAARVRVITPSIVNFCTRVWMVANCWVRPRTADPTADPTGWNVPKALLPNTNLLPTLPSATLRSIMIIEQFF